MHAEQKDPWSKAAWYGSLALGAMPLLGLRPMVMVIVLWFVLCCVARIRSFTSASPQWRTWFVLSAPFLLMLVDIGRADLLLDGWRNAERSAALVVFPTGFLLLAAPSDKRLRDQLTTLFALSATALAIIVNAMVLPKFFGAAGMASFSSAYRNAFWETSGIHPPYAAYWFLTGVLFHVHVLLLKRSERTIGSGEIAWRIASSLLLLLAALLIGSRMPLIAFAVATVLMLFMRMRTTTAVPWTVGVLTLFGFLVVLVPGIRERAIELVSLGDHSRLDGSMNSIEIRGPITQCSIELLEDHWILGVGSTSLQPALDQCYRSIEHASMVGNGYGPHDQALHWWLAYGLAGLLLFVLLFGWSLQLAWRRWDAQHLAFLVFMLLCCFTEDLLNRQWGVVFFACFNTLFVACGRSDPRLTGVGQPSVSADR